MFVAFLRRGTGNCGFTSQPRRIHRVQPAGVGCVLSQCGRAQWLGRSAAHSPSPVLRSGRRCGALWAGSERGRSAHHDGTGRSADQPEGGGDQSFCPRHGGRGALGERGRGARISPEEGSPMTLEAGSICRLRRSSRGDFRRIASARQRCRPAGARRRDSIPGWCSGSEFAAATRNWKFRKAIEVLTIERAPHPGPLAVAGAKILKSNVPFATGYARLSV